jgi:hypothetical protein
MKDRYETTVLSSDQISKILPHRYPFLLVDRVVEFEAGKSVYMYISIFLCINMYICKYIYICMYIYINKYVYIHIYISTYVQEREPLESNVSLPMNHRSVLLYKPIRINVYTYEYHILCYRN